MQRFRWFLGVFACLFGAFVLGQVPGTIPPVKMPQFRPPVKTIPGVAGALEAGQPFIARYALCNAAQLYESRRMIWEPVYLDYGVSSEDIESYRRNIVLFFKDFCGEHPGSYWQGALDNIEAFNWRVDEQNARVMGVAVGDATMLRLSQILAGLEEFRSRCLTDSGAGPALGQDLVTIFGSLLPATSGPPGLSLGRKSTTDTLGRCQSKSGAGGFKWLSLNQRSLAACLQNALSQSDTCDDPAAEGPRGNATATPAREESCTNVGGLETCHGGRTINYDNGARQVERRTTTSFADSAGVPHEITTLTRDTWGSEGEYIGTRQEEWFDGEQVHSFPIPMRPAHPDDGRFDRQHELGGDPGGDDRVPLTPETGFVSEVNQWSYSSGSSDFRPGPPVISGWRRNWVPAPAGGPARRECQGVNPGSATPIGLAYVQDASGGGVPFRAGRLDTFDLIGQCMCTSLGRFGPQLAHQAGFSCGPDENTRRLDCLLNPSGLADGVRPECVAFLDADNPGRDTLTALNEWCGHVAQCPPGAGIATTSGSGGAMCSCGTGLAAPRGGGGSTPGGSRCAAVSCAGGAGAAGSDLYRQCCGVPGELPGTMDPTPGSPVPRPPNPGELPKMPIPEMPKQPLPPK